MKLKSLRVPLLLFAGSVLFAQDKSQIFSLTPIAKGTSQVNGMAFGLGTLWNREQEATINGLNLELNPLTPFILLVLDPSRVPNDKTVLTHNGLHISTAGFMGEIRHNGLAVSVYHITYKTNGASVSGLYNVSKTLNGFHISGIANSVDEGGGVLIAAVNSADVFKGLQLGACNKSVSYTGVQIGLVNMTRSMRGLQIGLWNINEKRSLPFINF